MIDQTAYPTLHRLAALQLARWPEHEKYLSKSFAGRPEAVMETSEQIAKLVVALGDHVKGGLDTLCDDYRFLCTDIVLPEEEFFRRNDRYRLSTFEEALRTVYANATFMERYMNGLLLSDIFWDNHARALDAYQRDYLPCLKPGARHLEIGPGHGLLMYFASQLKTVATLEAWDVSQTSIDQTARSFKTMNVTRPVTLRLQNLFAVAEDKSLHGSFDSVVISEVLEHLERPDLALQMIHNLLAPGGVLWVHVPANSPAPDHLYLISDYEDAGRLVKDNGFALEKELYFATQGTSLDRARRQKLAVSCCIIGRKSA